jgi:predicted PurR-regulated permease PerM
MADAKRTLPLSIGAQPVLVVLVGVFGALAAFAIVTAAHRQVGWALASLVMAALLEPLVQVLDRRLPRALAILVGLLTVAVVVGGVVYGVLSDVGNQLDRVREAAPEAARELQESERFGEAATEFRLEERVQEVMDRLQDPTSGVGNEAASAAGTYFLCGILTAFFLAWGPRYARAALAQIEDPGRRWMARTVARDAYRRGQGYVFAAVCRGLVAGGIAAALCQAEGVPGPIVLGVTVAAFTAVPGFGILLGALPALLLEAGLGTTAGALRMLAAFVVLQVIDLLVLRRLVVPRTVVVGSAVLVIAVVVGFEVYGFGGAVYGAALAVWAVALLDAAARRDVTLADAMPELSDADPTSQTVLVPVVAPVDPALPPAARPPL